jgi:DNA helicase-2/ATP-dependent DNA helicase PcrA
VRVLNVVEACIPSAKATRTSDEIEEELRLLHVAMTRTKDELELIVPQRLFMYQQNHDRHVYTKLSRFIPKSIHHAFEQKHWNERTSVPSFHQSKWHSAKIDVASRVERMWR